MTTVFQSLRHREADAAQGGNDQSGIGTSAGDSLEAR